jgi:hypothetical protein
MFGSSELRPLADIGRIKSVELKPDTGLVPGGGRVRH